MLTIISNLMLDESHNLFPFSRKTCRTILKNSFAYDFVTEKENKISDSMHDCCLVHAWSCQEIEYSWSWNRIALCGGFSAFHWYRAIQRFSPRKYQFPSDCWARMFFNIFNDFFLETFKLLTKFQSFDNRFFPLHCPLEWLLSRSFSSESSFESFQNLVKFPRSRTFRFQSF